MDMLAYYFTFSLINSQIPNQFYCLLHHFLLFNTPPTPSMQSDLPLPLDSKVINIEFKKKLSSCVCRWLRLCPCQAFCGWVTGFSGEPQLGCMWQLHPKCAFVSCILAQLVKNPPAMQETQVQFLGQEDPLEKAQATLSSIHRLPSWPRWERIPLQCGRPGFDPWVGGDPPEEGLATHSSILAWRIAMDRGAWWATGHRVSKNQTGLSN